MPTILHRLRDWAKDSPQAPAQRYKQSGRWTTVSARQYCDRVFHLALFLESRGIVPGDVGTILSYNCPEWVHTELALLLIGAVSAGLYPNLAPADIRYILDDTRTRMVAVQNRRYWEKIAELEGGHEHIESILVFDGDTKISPRAIAYEDALAEGRRLAAGKSLDDYLDRIDSQREAFLIYTSGTTGNPKGAILSHDNLVFAVDLVTGYINLPRGGDLFSFLPLCHIAEKLQNLGVGIICRYTVNYCSQFENTAAELPEVQPTALLCVPRVWEKMMEAVERKLRESGMVRRKLARWAFAVARTVAEAEYTTGPSRVALLQLMLARRLVLSRIKKALGLLRAGYCVSGAAPLPVHVKKWFLGLGIDILEDFGQTESSGVICVTPPGVDCAGSVGKAVPGIEFTIADDGEILTRGRHVFQGYFRAPEATRATVTDGWLHTGDLGKIENGLVHIIGRKKELLKTSGGKMIAPVPIEESIKRASPLISEVCLVGDGRKYFSALVTLCAQALKDEAQDRFVIDEPRVIQEIQSACDKANLALSCYAQVKHFKVLANDFSVQTGELTPTLKLKRRAIEHRYQKIIEQMYRPQDLEETGDACPLLCSPETCFCSRRR